MKKLVSAMLSIVMILSLMSCNETIITTSTKENTSAYSLFKKGNDKLEALESRKQTVTMAMDISIGGTEVSITSSAVIKSDKVGGEPSASIDSTFNFLGNVTSNNVYYTEGKAYINSKTDKYYMDATYDEVLKNYGFASSLDLSEEMFKGSVVKIKKGYQVVNVSIKADTLKDQLMSSLGQIETFFKGLSINDITFSDIDAIFTFNSKGYMIESNYKFSASFDIKGKAYNVSVDMTVTLDNPGSKVDISKPENLSKYKALEDIDNKTVTEE